MIYATQEDYTAYLCGREPLITEGFGYYARQASAVIDEHAFQGIPEPVPECVRFCCCELAELLYREALSQPSGGAVASESVQGWSVSYESTEARTAALRRSQRDCIAKWLGNTGLLYAGVS